ncbi:MAG: hypothetical protein HY525_16060 [Betaproteobacteria bacterium]|nr:hypothetical protein [Betaproteobacteria bacterium]
MLGTTFVFNPTAPTSKKSRPVERTLKSLKGATVGVLDNAKPNFDHLADAIGELLTERYGVAKIVKRRKRVAGIPAPEAIMQAMAQCDLVITGAGD